MSLQRSTYYLILQISILLFACNSTDNKVENKIESEIISDTIVNNLITKENFLLFVDSIQPAKVKQGIYTFYRNNPGLQITTERRVFLNLPKKVLNSLDSTSLVLFESINYDNIYAHDKIILEDSTIIIIYRDKNFFEDSFKNKLNEFIITYSNSGAILSFLPTVYTFTNHNFVESAYTNFLENKNLNRFIAILDTLKPTASFKGYYRQEYSEILTISKDGTIKTLKKRTNVLQSFLGTFVWLEIVDNKFKAFQTCERTFNTLDFVSDSNGKRYFLIYKDKDREIKFEIVSMWIEQHNNTKEYSEIYSGEYCYLTLLNTKTNENVGTLIMGQAGISGVTEFMWPNDYDDLGYYYCWKHFVDNKDISTNVPDCE